MYNLQDGGQSACFYNGTISGDVRVCGVCDVERVPKGFIRM